MTPTAAPDAAAGTAPGSRRWLGLAALCAAFFMVILDVAIVNPESAITGTR